MPEVVRLKSLQDANRFLREMSSDGNKMTLPSKD